MSEAKTEPTASEPRYLYYRVYCPDGAIPSKTAFNPRNPYVGRILAKSIPPPHNATTLKRCLLRTENLTDPHGQRTQLYRDHDARSHLAGTDRVGIFGPVADGATPDSALALVLRDYLSADEKATVARIDLSCPGEEEPKYLYYRLFTDTGEDVSKVSFNLNEPSLGRVERNLISPPHSPPTIRRYIAKVEGRPIYTYSEFYQNISAQQALKDNIYLPLARVGLTQEDPIVLVQPKRQPGLYNRPVKIIFSPLFELFGGSLAYTDGVLQNNRYKCTYNNKSSYLSPGNIAFPRSWLDQ
ncbi:hypothetical protein MSAN_01596200 [Mycena sanguinolenta]|uniref:Uncharacterized protein n=1 Tax=Mycena sanguinolenta TaxID=230812 RepID=A0A8H6Y463_9AGAR|nr:hypothetical protein MSAN_01596200 [Mycena sanguinolenta]